MYKQKHTGGILLILLLLTAVLPAGADILSFQEVTSFLSADQKSVLLDDGEVTMFHFDEFSPQLLPPVGQKDSIADMVKGQELNMGIEGLFLYRDFNSEAFEKDQDAVLLKMYNVLRSISTLEGIEYYSASRDEMRTLFVESWVIPDLENPDRKLPDLLVSDIPSYDKFFIHQKDKSFGKHESLMEFSYDAPVISTAIVNQTNMYYKGFIKAVKPEQMQIHLVIMPTDEGLLFYGITAADTLNMKAFREKANNSFYNRVKAMYQWYTAEWKKIS